MDGIEVHELAVEGGRTVGPELAHDGDRLLQTGAPVGIGDADRGVLLLLPPDAQPEHHPVTGKTSDGGGPLGQDDRTVQRRHHH